MNKIDKIDLQLTEVQLHDNLFPILQKIESKKLSAGQMQKKSE